MFLLFGTLLKLTAERAARHVVVDLSYMRVWRRAIVSRVGQRVGVEWGRAEDYLYHLRVLY